MLIVQEFEAEKSEASGESVCLFHSAGSLGAVAGFFLGTLFSPEVVTLKGAFDFPALIEERGAFNGREAHGAGLAFCRRL